MDVVIIEDEPLVAKDLEKQIQRIEPKANILALITSVQAARNWFSEHNPPDLVFSDLR